MTTITTKAALKIAADCIEEIVTRRHQEMEDRADYDEKRRLEQALTRIRLLIAREDGVGDYSGRREEERREWT